MEKKPNKKEELTLVNNVLKLATKLLKVLVRLLCSFFFVSHSVTPSPARSAVVDALAWKPTNLLL